MILFVTSIIKSGSEILAFALEAVNFASPIINSVLEIIISAPDTINFGFQKINRELETIISGLDMVIVKPSITNCVPVAVLFAIVAVKSRDRSSLGCRGDNYFQLRSVISALNMIIFASQTIKSGSETIWFECHMIISVPEMIFFAPEMVICGHNKMKSRAGLL